MDITEETKKIGGSSIMRYALLFLGLIILFLSQSVLTWKRTSERDAAGDIAAVQFDIKFLEDEIKNSDDAAEKKDMREELKELKEEKLEDARFEAAAESVDAKNGIWLCSMLNLAGLGLSSLGLLIIAATGGSHEKLGALIAIGFIVTRL